MESSTKSKEDLKKLDSATYKADDSMSGLEGAKFGLKKDDTAELMANLCFVRNQLYQEILESFGIPIEYDEEDGTKSEVDELVDEDPNYSIQYDNKAYVEEEQSYAENKFGTTLNLSQIDPNKSIGDLIVLKYQNDEYGYPDDNGGNGYTEIAGFVGELPDKIGNWYIKKSIQWIEKNSTPHSRHICAMNVRRALEAGGISTAGRPGNAIEYRGFLPSIGFRLVRLVKYNVNYAKYMKSEVAPGDIAVMANPRGGAGHICMYTGSQWISDFKQPRAWVYGGQCGMLYIYRYKAMTEEIIKEMSTAGAELKGWGICSLNGLSFMQSCEGWSDARKKGFMGTFGTDAVAGNQSGIDRGGVITVGPGLTNSVSKFIRSGVHFSCDQIMAIWSTIIVNATKRVLAICPALKSLPQGCKDMAIDCYHSGEGHFKNAGWARVKTPQDAARACQNMVKTAKGKVVRGLADRRSAEAAICLGKQCTGSAKRYTDAYYHPSAKFKSVMAKYTKK